MRCLVTGSSGHLGEALVRTLRDRGATVVGLDQRPSPFTSATGSITDPDLVRSVMHDVDVVFHPATLHKPHVATHPRREFVATNVTGTLTLLEAAVEARVQAFVFTSTTSAFGRALSPPAGAPAVWVTEDTVPVPRNVYGATKLAAEHLAEEVHHSEGLPVVILRTSRFFPEPDDRPEVRRAFADDNLKANELLHRRVDVADVVEAHLLAAERAPSLGFGRYIVSASTPFEPGDLEELRRDVATVVARRFPEQPALYARAGWRLPATIDRVYSSARAREELGWVPRYGFAEVLDSLRTAPSSVPSSVASPTEEHTRRDWRSPLTHEIGIKGYHDGAFDDGLYPVD